MSWPTTEGIEDIDPMTWATGTVATDLRVLASHGGLYDIKAT